jgi:superfamily II DNA or RNA helicase
LSHARTSEFIHRDHQFSRSWAEEVRRTVQDSPSPAAAAPVHSNAPDEALEALDKLEEPDSPYRIVVSVGMLNVGWDVKSVYVIASLRASVSDLLTEQTLGRGCGCPSAPPPAWKSSTAWRC